MQNCSKFFCTLIKKIKKISQIKNFFLKYFRILKKTEENFLALSIIKENENLRFNFDHKKNLFFACILIKNNGKTMY